MGQKNMSARRAKQDFKAGVQQLENMWDSLAEKHLSECILFTYLCAGRPTSLNIPFNKGTPYGCFFSVCLRVVSCPAHAHLPARNGLVIEVDYLGLIPQKW